MTERLSQLLAGEADGLDVPPPATGEVLRQGRGLRRRNRAIVGAAGLAAAVVVGGSVAALAGGGGNSAAPDPAGTPAGLGAVYAIGNDVYLDGGAHRVTVDDKAVKSLYYTSAGVLVREGNNSASDGGGPQRFSLVTPDGTVTKLGLETEETVHATDPDQPYVAYAQAVDGQLVVFVRDVTTDEEVARVTVGPTRESWFPVAIDGENVFVQDGYDGGRYVVDWRAGDVQESDVLDSVWSVGAGHTVSADGSAVIDSFTGDTVFDIPDEDGLPYAALSPDGDYVRVVVQDYQTPHAPDTMVYDVSTGAATAVDGDQSWGWTAEGDLFSLTDKGALTTCDLGSGQCTEQQVDLPAPPPEVCHTESTGGATSTWCDGGQLDIILGGTIRES